MTCARTVLAQRCYPVEPTPADATPWTITPGSGDLEVTKTLPNGLVVTGTIIARSGIGRFAPGTPLGDSDPNAILVITDGPSGNSWTQVSFDAPVRQGPDTLVKVYDLDLQGVERLHFLDARYRRDADVNTPLLGQPIQWNAAGQNWRSFSNDNRSSQLTFAGEPWGGSAGPVRVQFTNTGGQSGAMFDFAGDLVASAARPASLLATCDTGGDREWVDLSTGTPLTPAQVASLHDC